MPRGRVTDDSEFNAFADGMALLSTLTQTSYSQPPPWWDSLDNTLVRLMQYDHLKQQAWIQANPLAPKIQPWPANMTMRDSARRLQQLIPPAMRGRVTIGAAPKKWLGQPRKSCDLCTSFVDVGDI